MGWVKLKLMTMRLTFDALMLAFFVFAFTQAMGFRALAQTFPMTAAGAGIVVTGLLVLRDIYGAVQVTKDEEKVFTEEDRTATLIRAAQDQGSIAPTLRGFAKQSGWIGGFLGLSWVLSLPVGAVVYVVLFLRLEAGMRWRTAVIGAVLTLAGLVVMVEMMNLEFPPSLWSPLGQWLG